MSSKWIQGSVVDQHRWADRLYSIRIDAALEPFRAGQFARLALEIGGEMVARPYSFVNAPHEKPFEFYYIHLDDGPLTTRLIELLPDDPIFLAPRAAGFLTLSEVPEAEHLWMLSTGPAVGPFLSILKTDDPWARFSRVVLVHAVRETGELTYPETLAALRAAHPGQFVYVPFVSRQDTDFAIRARIPDAIRDGRLETAAGIRIDAGRSQAMLCGNPAMVTDTLAMLEARGLKRHKRKEPGQVHVESYW
jgi:ferredoxin--NADP+ reductase